ncbi:DUF6236 family protein [Shewanella algae]|uniref:DUF6236 family protein n=1 Tax=Shewanella algae TaxID=38313 RepID=UPI0030048C8B
MPNQALFYPHIDIIDDQWLKTSLLYWDELRTIVPESIESPYRTNSTEALYDLGFLTPIRVNSDMREIEDLSEAVITYLTTNEGARLIASNGHRDSVIHSEKLPYQLDMYSHIHPEKLPYHVQGELRRIFRETDKDGWLRVDSGFANFYMTLLASKLSERTGSSLVTSDSMANDLAIAVHLDAPLGREVSNIVDGDWRRRKHRREYEAFGRRQEHPPVVAEGLLANLAISKICITEDNSVDDILKFKHSHADELGLFHQKISELCSGIDEDIPIEAMQEKVSTIYNNEVKPSINNLKAALKGKNIQWKAEGLMKLTFMSASSYSALAVAGLSTPLALLAGAGISFTAMSVLHNIEKRNEIRNSPFAYLMSAERSFA